MDMNSFTLGFNLEAENKEDADEKLSRIIRVIAEDQYDFGTDFHIEISGDSQDMRDISDGRWYGSVRVMMEEKRSEKVKELAAAIQQHLHKSLPTIHCTVVGTL